MPRSDRPPPSGATPGFRLDRGGHECQWNGPSWPFATSVTLTALARLLHERESAAVGRRAYFETLSCYTRSHYLREENRTIPWIDENLDPFTGEWLARSILQSWEKAGIRSDALIRERGKDYSHSTYADLIITGLCGIDPDLPGEIRAAPLLPSGMLGLLSARRPLHTGGMNSHCSSTTTAAATGAAPG
ncbi:MAG: hypothetical protein L6W00_03825 [Lentisphaeria bacterium]|nr:MAG: hypothetical protein L6W00_03825 [Lentisphaeria bacterium]